MMRTFSTLSILALLTLTACGGGGDSEYGVSLNSSVNPYVSISVTNNGGNQNNTPNTSNHLPEQQGQTMYWRDYLVYENGKAVRSPTYGQANAEDGYPQNDFRLMNLDGRQFQMIPTGNTDKTVIETNQNGVRSMIGANLSYARYGVVLYDNEKTDYVFYQGYATDAKQMPQTGSAKYTGYAIAYRESDRAISKGLSSFDVNFAAKTVKGTLTLDKFGTHSVQAKIDGNEIVKVNNGGIHSGYFYGKNAQEMAGDFYAKHQNKEIYGNFGAKKK